jgi:hypothetical protein
VLFRSIVSYVNGNTFELVQTGFIDGLSGLVPTRTYFLSDVTAGALTYPEPTTYGHISKAVLIAYTTTSAWVLPYAGYVISSGGTANTEGERITKVVTQSGHTFVVNDVVGWSSSQYSKAIANGAYNGEVIGVVTTIRDANTFEVTQSGYFSGFSAGLSANTTYFLSNIIAGQLTAIKPATLGHVVRPIIATTAANAGWVLPYPGYVLTTGTTFTATTVAAGLGLTDSANTFNVNILQAIAVGTEIPVKIDLLGTNKLYIDSNDITGNTGTITGATNITTLGGTGIYDSTSGQSLQFRSLKGSGFTSISQVGNDIIIYSTASGGTPITGGTNIGIGTGVYDSPSGQKLQFRSLVGSGNTTVTQSGNTVVIYSTGGTGGGTWGSITGTLSDQTDLWDVLTGLSANTIYNLQSPVAICVGGVNVGYVLTGKSLSCIIQDILVPELFQTSVGTPSTSVGGAGGTYEVGCSLSLTITPTYTAGAITPLYCSTSPFTRGGVANAYNYKGCCLPDTGFITNTSCSVNPYIVSAGTQTWCVRTRYNVGSCIKGSKGTVNPTYPTVCPASGCTTFGSTSLSGIYPYYYGKLTGGTRPSVTNALVTTCCMCKCVASSTGTVTITFGSSASEYTWLAIPQTSTSKLCWYVTALDNGFMNRGCPTDKYPDECIIAITSGEGCWSSINYKVYMSGAVGAIAAPIEFRNS